MGGVLLTERCPRCSSHNITEAHYDSKYGTAWSIKCGSCDYEVKSGFNRTRAVIHWNKEVEKSEISIEIKKWASVWQIAGSWNRDYGELPDFDRMNFAVEKLRELGLEVSSNPLPNPPFINAWQLEIMKDGQLIEQVRTGREWGF